MTVTFYDKASTLQDQQLGDSTLATRLHCSATRDAIEQASVRAKTSWHGDQRDIRRPSSAVRHPSPEFRRLCSDVCRPSDEHRSSSKIQHQSDTRHPTHTGSLIGDVMIMMMIDGRIFIRHHALIRRGKLPQGRFNTCYQSSLFCYGCLHGIGLFPCVVDPPTHSPTSANHPYPEAVLLPESLARILPPFIG